jgi:methylmalonyl-CoA mutase cobalamin-binding subunit
VEQNQIYFVCGGVFADGRLDRLEAGAAPECYGPFTDLEAAERACSAQRRRNVDICWHHLYVVSTLTPG